MSDYQYLLNPLENLCETFYSVQGGALDSPKRLHSILARALLLHFLRAVDLTTNSPESVLGEVDDSFDEDHADYVRALELSCYASQLLNVETRALQQTA